MKNKVMLFEEFVGSLNEGKDWYDFKPENIAKAFMKDGEPGEGPTVTTDQLDQWIDGFAYDKKIEDGLPYDVASDIVDFLKKKGYKNLDVDDLRTDGAFESAIYESSFIVFIPFIKGSDDIDTDNQLFGVYTEEELNRISPGKQLGHGDYTTSGSYKNSIDAEKAAELIKKGKSTKSKEWKEYSKWDDEKTK